MRVLKRDLPLTILVDLLLQVLFVVTIMWLVSANSLEEFQGRNGSFSVEELNAKLKELELANAALKAENQKLISDIEKYREELEERKAYIAKLNANIGEEKLKMLLLRSGLPDCFNGEKKNVSAIVVQWKSDSSVQVLRGSDFDSLASSINNSQSLLGEFDPSQLLSKLSPLINHQNSNNCKVRVRFIAPKDAPPARWDLLRTNLLRVFRTDTAFN